MLESAQNKLYDPRLEHDACGIGAVVSLRGIKTHQTVDNALKIVEKLEHRAGKDAAGETGDGVGLMIQIPHKLMVKAAAAEGITLAFHNHSGEFLPNKDGQIPHEEMQKRTKIDFEIDTCWANVGGENPSKYVLKYTGRAPVVHLKDFAGSKSENMYELIGIDKKVEHTNTFEFRPVGFGNQNIPDILAASEKAGAGWVVVEQDQPSMGKTPLECAKMSRDYLKLLGW